MNDREQKLDIINEFIQSCFDAEGDIDETGYMWDLSDVRNYAKDYLKPKKELVVPWELIDESISEIEVLKDKRPFFIKSDCEIRIRHLAYYLKLDLEGVDLPVTVNRPEVK